MNHSRRRCVEIAGNPEENHPSIESNCKLIHPLPAERTDVPVFNSAFANSLLWKPRHRNISHTNPYILLCCLQPSSSIMMHRITSALPSPLKKQNRVVASHRKGGHRQFRESGAFLLKTPAQTKISTFMFSHTHHATIDEVENRYSRNVRGSQDHYGDLSVQSTSA